MKLSEALAEASLNSVQHAYGNKEELEYPIADTRWWAAAFYQNDMQEVRFVVCDLGMGIPATLPKSSLWTTMSAALGGGSEGAAGVAPYIKDGVMLKTLLSRASDEKGLSQHQTYYRGKGFPQMAQAIVKREGILRVISGRGSAILYPLNRISDVRNYERHLGGTLLEWRFQNADGD